MLNVLVKQSRCKKAPLDQEFEETSQVKLNAVDRKTCWTMLLQFNKHRWKKILLDVYGEDIDANSYEFIFARNLIFDHMRVYKNKTIDKMIVSLSNTLTYGLLLISLRSMLRASKRLVMLTIVASSAYAKTSRH